jgi:hypothetical protein
VRRNLSHPCQICKPLSLIWREKSNNINGSIRFESSSSHSNSFKISGVLETIAMKWMKNSHLLHDLEKIMIYLSDLTQDCHPTRMKTLSTTPCFLHSLFSLIQSWRSLDDKSSLSALQFHRSYHLGLFVLLGLINGRSLCEEFLRVMTMGFRNQFNYFRQLTKLISSQ